MGFNANLAETKHISLLMATSAIWDVIYRLYLTTLLKMCFFTQLPFQPWEARALGDLNVAHYPVSILDPILLPIEAQRLENPSVFLENLIHKFLW